MNYGTPQEMVDEERDYCKTIGKNTPESGCLPILIVIIIVAIMLIIKNIWMKNKIYYYIYNLLINI